MLNAMKIRNLIQLHGWKSKFTRLKTKNIHDTEAKCGYCQVEIDEADREKRTFQVTSRAVSIDPDENRVVECPWKVATGD